MLCGVSLKEDINTRRLFCFVESPLKKTLTLEGYLALWSLPEILTLEGYFALWSHPCNVEGGLKKHTKKQIYNQKQH